MRSLLDSICSTEAVLGVAAIKNNPSGRATAKGFSIAHEYAVFVGKGEDSKIGRLSHSDEQRSRYKEADDVGQFEWVNFRKHGGANANRIARPKLYYALFVSDGAFRIPEQEWDAGKKEWALLEKPEENETTVYPVTPNGDEKTWKWGIDTVRANLQELKAGRDQSKRPAVYLKVRFNDQGTLPRTIWDKKEYSSTEYGTNLLARMFGDKEVFSFPKSVHAVSDCLTVANSHEESVNLDFFAGSGTTGHALIQLNRADGGRRRFVLIEMGSHLDEALVPRVKKVTFAPEWKDGKPSRLATPKEAERSPRIVKVVRLESYEDALNNLETRRTDKQQLLLDAGEAQDTDGFREQYFLRYMLDVETRGSQSLLNVQAFADPTAYKLKVKRPGSDESREVNVDLLETFNWLIGLTVRHIAAPQTFSGAFERDSEKRLRMKGRLKQEENGPYWFRTVTGATPDDRPALIIWRKLTGEPEQDNLVLDEWFTRQGYSAKESEFELIYVNGGNNLENLKDPDDLWKVRLIEEDFQRLMFEMEGA